MTLAEIIESAYVMTGRRDITVGQMTIQLWQVIKQVVLSGKWPEDYFEKEVVLPQGFSHTHTLSLSDNDLLGVIAYEFVAAKMADNSIVPLARMMPRAIVQSAGTCQARDSYYQMANSLQLHCRGEFDRVLIGYYSSPVQGEAHWTMHLIPEILTAGLSAQVYRLLGEVESFSMYETEFQRLLAIFKANRADTEVT